MSTITITGKFTGSINNFVQIDFYRPNPDSYNLSKQYQQSFEFILNDLLPGRSYLFDLTGYTTGNFEIIVTGDITDSIDDTYTNSFTPGLVVTTKVTSII